MVDFSIGLATKRPILQRPYFVRGQFLKEIYFVFRIIYFPLRYREHTSDLRYRWTRPIFTKYEFAVNTERSEHVD